MEKEFLDIVNENAQLNCTLDANSFLNFFSNIGEGDLVKASQEAEKQLQLSDQKAKKDHNGSFELFSDTDDTVLICASQIVENNNLLELEENDCLIKATQDAEDAYLKEQKSDDQLIAGATAIENHGVNPDICGPLNTETSDGRFKFKGESSYEQLGSKQYAKSSETKVKWAVDTFEEWRTIRNQWAKQHANEGLSTICDGVPLCQFSKDELNFSISRFVKECRNKKGEQYPPTTLREIVLCLQMYLNKLGFSYKFLSDPIFSQLRNSLDSTMKEIAEKGIGLNRKQAEIITADEEEKLWDCGALGSSSPTQLLHTMFFLNGVHFALRGGSEHRNLRLGQTSQFKVLRDSQNCEYLQYTEDKSKTNQGGLAHLRVKPKVVRAYANTTNPERCIVNLFKKYVSHCPVSEQSDAFYKQELKKPGLMWYSKQPKGVHSLQKIVAAICEEGGLKGYRTNHSLRATAASRLYQNGVDEQLIQEVTGHRSVAVREYKRTNEVQKRDISSILGGSQRVNKKICTESKLESSARLSHEGINITLNVNFQK